MMTSTATLQDCVFAIHFASPIGLTVLDMANWVAANEGQFPQPQQQPLYGPVDFQEIGAPQFPSFTMVASDEMPRMLLRTVEGSYTLQLQTDRFVFTWTRTKPLGELDDYPGYAAMKVMWQRHVENFLAWHAQRLGGMPSLRLVELGYYNNALMELPSGETKRIMDVFKWVQPGRPVNGFQANWVEVIKPDGDVPVVPAAPRVMANAGVGSVFPGRRVFSFSFVGLAAASEVGLNSDASGALDVLHARILDMHASAFVSGSQVATPS